MYEINYTSMDFRTNQVRQEALYFQKMCAATNYPHKEKDPNVIPTIEKFTLHDTKRWVKIRGKNFRQDAIVMLFTSDDYQGPVKPIVPIVESSSSLGFVLPMDYETCFISVTCGENEGSRKKFHWPGKIIDL